MHNDLLAIARGLAESEGVGRSRTAQRRTVSSAYYAAFHALAGLCADALVGASQPWDVVSPVYRSLDHASIRRVFEASRQRRALGDWAVRAGETILVLQQVRHTADYDPEPFAFGRRECLDLIEQARLAIETLLLLDPDLKLKLAVQLIAKPRRG